MIACLPLQKDGGEIERAYSILSILCNAYVWCEGEANPAKVLPAVIAVPLCKASERLGMGYTIPAYVLSLPSREWVPVIFWLFTPFSLCRAHAGITPLLTNASAVLWNWRRFDTQKPVELSNLACLRTTGQCVRTGPLCATTVC